MGLQDLAWLGAAIVAALSAYNFITSLGQHKGATDAQIAHHADNENKWNIRFEALHNLVTMHYEQANNRITTQQAETSARFERVLERLNEALLTMAREHPTKTDLQHMKDEILARIDGAEYTPRPSTRRKTKEV
jgi:dipeptidase